METAVDGSPKKPWDMTPAERLDSFEGLRANWDSYGALRISPLAIAEARRLLEHWHGQLPFVVPLSNGGIGFEFDNENHPMTILPDGTLFWEDDQ